MLKQYNVRLPITDVKAIDGLGGCRSVHIRTAIVGYLQNDMSSYSSDVYTKELIDVLKEQVLDLKNDKQQLQKRVDYFSLGWFQRLLLPKH